MNKDGKSESINYKPNLFIAGAPKCGTSALAAYLATHQDICLPIKEELNILDAEFEATTNFDAACKKYFKNAIGTKYRCDSTPTYFQKRDALKNIARHYSRRELKEVRVIILVRDPCDRFLSHLSHRVSRSGEDKLSEIELRSIESAISKVENATEKVLAAQEYDYLLAGFYYGHLMAWRKVFDEKQILVLRTAELKDSNTINKLAQFLELRAPRENLIAERNVTSAPRWGFVRRAMAKDGGLIKSVGKAMFPEHVRPIIRRKIIYLFASKSRFKVEIDARLLSRVRRIYEKDKARFEKETGVSL